MTGILYLVATPIGNMEDISVRAIKTLHEVDYLACEDTRRTGLLLKALIPMFNKLIYNTQENRLSRKPNLISFYEQNEAIRIPQIISLLQDGKNVALVSNAGTPTISDPGFKLVRECLGLGIKVISIPGASAVLTAVISSGLPTDKLLFLGYLPKKEGKKNKILADILKFVKNNENLNPTIVFFEAPHRLLKTLEALRNVFGDMEIVICRELTKVHEEVKRLTLLEASQAFNQTPPRGEFTIVFKINLPQGEDQSIGQKED